MEIMVGLLGRSAAQVWHTFAANWPFLLAGTVAAAVIRVYLDERKVAAFLRRNQGRGVLAATAAGVATPLCSCGTTAVILGMMASRMPWAPIVAFMVASPLTSPEELLYSGGLFGWRFAWTFFVASVVLGLLGGLAAYVLERTGWLSGQARMDSARRGGAGGPGGSGLLRADRSGTDQSTAGPRRVELLPSRPVLEGAAGGPGHTWGRLGREIFAGVRQLLPRFLGFAFLGYFLNGLIPQAWIVQLFGRGQGFGVPVAATLGLPLYFNTESSLPLLKALIDNGMSPGAGLAFLITGAGTSLGAIAGALTIARWRVIAVVVATLWIGALLFGWGYNALFALGTL